MLQNVSRRAYAVASVLLLASLAMAQTLPSSPPPRPRLLFTASDIPALQARITGGGVPDWAFSQLASGASFQTGVNQATWQVYRSLRFMLEAAVRWKLTGNTSARYNALSLLIRGYPNAIGHLVPTGSFKPYIEATYPGAIAMTFDLLYDELTVSERATIVTELQGWVNAMYAGSAGPGSYSQYGGATDNQSFAWNTAIALSLLAIWGEPGVNNANLPAEVDAALAKLEDGYRDVVSPDGSYDESAGYAQYGGVYSLRAHYAAQNCGFPDRVTGTNAKGLPSWFGRLLMGDSFHWTGDSSPTHRGVEFDPILYWIVKREVDPEGLWFLEHVRAFQNISIDTSTFAFSPFISAFLHYPDTMQPQAPEVMSGFYRDNLNVVPNGFPNWNKLNNNHAVGLGGSAWLHNTSDPANENAFGVHYVIRDEWMNHGHEDDGHVDLVNKGVHHVLDRGYATASTYQHAQSTHHNIVTVSGPGFLGGTTNTFQAPYPEGRYHGSLKGKLLSPSFDYLRGDHRFLWMMERADRTVLLIKDPATPFAIVLDQVRKTGGTHTYEQRWNTAGPMNGAGTPSNPVTITAGQETMKAAWLVPTTVQIAQGTQQTNAGMTFHDNRVMVTGTGDTPILSLWYPGTIQASGPLPGAAPNTHGGVITWSSDRVDKVMTPIDQNPASDAENTLQGRFAWIRRDASGAIVEYAVGEAEQLLEGTQTVVDSPEPVTVVARDGEIWITRALDADPTVMPHIVMLAPATVSRVVLDGSTVAHVQNGSQVTIGTATTTPPPVPTTPPVTKDRFYSFTSGNVLDAVITGNATFQDGTLHARGVNTSVRPLGGATYPAQPLWVGFDLIGGGPHLASLQFQTTGPFGHIVTVECFAAPGGDVVAISQSLLAPPVVAQIPSHGASKTRVGVIIRPTLGTIELVDRFGQVHGSGACQVFTSETAIALHVTKDVRLDNFCVYDSVEDGIDPQGAVVWLHQDGRLGMAAQFPTVLQTTVSLTVAGQVMPSSMTSSWFISNAMVEQLLLPYTANWTSSPLDHRELAFETQVPGTVPVVTGLTYGVTGLTASGVTFMAGAWYQ